MIKLTIPRILMTSMSILIAVSYLTLSSPSEATNGDAIFRLENDIDILRGKIDMLESRIDYLEGQMR